MWRLSRMGHKWYAMQFDSLDDEYENIKGLVEEGDNVLLVSHLDDAQKLIDTEIIVVEAEE